jgi:hypothetical protein
VLALEDEFTDSLSFPSTAEHHTADIFLFDNPQQQMSKAPLRYSKTDKTIYTLDNLHRSVFMYWVTRIFPSGATATSTSPPPD